MILKYQNEHHFLFHYLDEYERAKIQLTYTEAIDPAANFKLE